MNPKRNSPKFFSLQDYMTNLNIDYKTLEKINDYLKLISDRSSGKLLTAASFMRKFISEHPKYKFDSTVNEEIAYDLLWRIQLVSTGEINCPEMFFERLHESN